MNIWLINHYAVPTKYYPLARPASIAKELIKKGNSVTIISASSVHNSDINLINGKDKFIELYEDGIRYIIIKCKSYSGNGISRISNMFEFAAKLGNVCNRLERPDVIIATSLTPMACAQSIKLGKKYGCKVIAEIADLWPESLIAYGLTSKYNPFVLYLRRLEKWIYMNADSIVFTMEGAYEYIKEQKWEKYVPKSKVFFINNGIDWEKYEFNKTNFVIRDPDLDNENIFKVVYCGSIRKVNNLGLLLDAAKKIENERVKLLIWGDGDELEKLKTRAISESIKNVVFKGKVGKEYIPFIVSKSDLNIMHGESTPIMRYGLSANKLFDYFAAGKPILCDLGADYNPVEEMHAGIDIKDATPEKVANAIDAFSRMNDADIYYYCANSSKAAQKYNFKELTSDLLEIINA